MTGQANETQWYIARDGKQHGPLTDVEMRTFVSHNYLRVSDLIWRPGMPEWQPAPELFPEAFPGADNIGASASSEPDGSAPKRATVSASKISREKKSAHHSDFETTSGSATDRGSLAKRLAIASVAVTLIGGGAFALATYHEPIMNMVSGSSGKSDTPPPVVQAPVASADVAASPPSDPAQSASSNSAPSTSPAAAPPTPPTTSSVPSPDSDRTQVANADPQAMVPGGPQSIDGSATDVKLRKVPVWALIKREYPDWYTNQVTAANKLVAENKSDNDVAALLAQGLVTLRRQNADKALAASSERLQKIAVAFLEHLKALRAQSVSACFGFISRGETSPAVVQMLENPEGATALNAQADAIFEAISEGAKSPVKHDSAVKSDYDMLIKELAKLGWKEEDLQVFSNPKLLAKREPEQVCKMVQEWFVAHLAVQDKAVRDRLLFETLKPVVSG